MINLKCRPNKTAKGFTKQYERRAKNGTNKNYKDKLLFDEKQGNINILMVHGTLDVLRFGKSYLLKRITIPHPVEPGFVKNVFVLNEAGKKYYLRVKKQYDRKKN